MRLLLGEPWKQELLLQQLIQVHPQARLAILLLKLQKKREFILNTARMKKLL
jgi:hypothetical protein